MFAFIGKMVHSSPAEVTEIEILDWVNYKNVWCTGKIRLNSSIGKIYMHLFFNSTYFKTGTGSNVLPWSSKFAYITNLVFMHE